MIQEKYNTKDIIDWDKLVIRLKTEEPSPVSLDQVIDPSKTDAKSVREVYKNQLSMRQASRSPFVEVCGPWEDANYNLENIYFENYFPIKNSYQDIVNRFAEFVNLEPLEVWISRVLPHKSVPFHTDENDSYEDWMQDGTRKFHRYSVFITDPIDYQLFIVGNDYWFNQPKHTTIKWKSDKELHALINCSRCENLLFHFVGRDI